MQLACTRKEKPDFVGKGFDLGATGTWAAGRRSYDSFLSLWKSLSSVGLLLVVVGLFELLDMG